MADLKQQIEDNAKGPSEANIDGQQVRQHPLSEQIAADRYLANKAAASRPLAGLRRTRAVPPGTV